MATTYTITGGTSEMLKVVKDVDGVQTLTLFGKNSHVNGEVDSFTITDNNKALTIPIAQCAQFASVADALDTLKTNAYLGFSSGSGGGGNIDAGTVEDSMLRWNNVGAVWEEDPTTLLEDETQNNGSTYNVLQKLLSRFTGAADVWFERAVTRLTSNNAAVAYGSAINTKSLTTTAKSALRAILIPSSQKAYTKVEVANATLTGEIEISVEQGMKFTTLGLQPTYRTYTAANDSFTVTTQDQVISCITGSYATTIFNGTVNLPASPLAAQKLTIFNDGEGQIIINGNGKDILGSGYSEYLSTRNSSCELQYNGTRWIVLKADQSRFFGTEVINGLSGASSYTAGYSPVAGKVIAIRIQVKALDIGAGTVLPTISATGLAPTLMSGTDETFVIDPTYAQSNAINLVVQNPSDYTTFDFRAIFEFVPF